MNTQTRTTCNECYFVANWEPGYVALCSLHGAAERLVAMLDITARQLHGAGTLMGCQSSSFEECEARRCVEARAAIKAARNE